MTNSNTTRQVRDSLITFQGRAIRAALMATGTLTERVTYGMDAAASAAQDGDWGLDRATLAAARLEWSAMTGRVELAVEIRTNVAMASAVRS